jgi:cytochrome c oxidase subunit II
VPRAWTIAGIIIVSCLCAVLFGWLLWLISGTPLSYLEGQGFRASNTAQLLWYMIFVSLAVIFFTCFVVLGGIYRPRQGVEPPTAIAHPPGDLAWIFTGVGVSTLLLLGTVIWTVIVLNANSAPRQVPALTIGVIGHQWWWEVRYENGDPSRTFTTANEIHIPVGKPIQFNLSAADVIHSFWVPKLAGKTDLIPGQTNKTWFEAANPGVFRGRCMEYCGLQHAHMNLMVIADPPDQFKAWQANQLLPQKQALADTSAAAGQSAFIQKCGVCHTVRGTGALGIVGPDLTHLMTRTTIAAGTLPNTVGYLSGWIADPQDIKPGSYMPRLNLSGPELERVRSFLRTLN